MSDTHGAESKTEQATPRRLEKAREEGSIVRAHAVAGAAVLLAGAAVLLVGGAKLAELLQLSLTFGLRIEPDHMRDPALLMAAAGQIVRPAATAMVPFLFLIAAVAFAADLLVGGWNVSTRPLMPDFSHIDPLKGLGRLFSRAALAEIVKALVKLAVIGGVAAILLRSRIAGLIDVARQSWPYAAHHVATLAAEILMILAAALAAVTLLEIPYQVWDHRTRLKMTRQDIKDEMRELDGSVETRRRIRGLRLRLARMRMMAEVPNADVVVVNPEHYAAALRYREGSMCAPRLVAKGTDLVALRIRDLAAEHGIPLIEAPPLARSICRFVDLGDEIPTGLYGVIAEVLAYVYRLRAARDAGQEVPGLPQDDRFQPPEEFTAPAR